MCDSKKICKECGCEFNPSKFTTVQKFCSKRCADSCSHRASSLRRIAACKVCGIEYHPKACDRTTACSRRCGFQYQRQCRTVRSRRAKDSHKAKYLLSHLAACAMCRSAFISKCGAKFCSDLCRKKQHAAKQNELYAASSSDYGKCRLCGCDSIRNGRACQLCITCHQDMRRMVKRKAKRRSQQRKYEQSLGQRATEGSRESLNLLRQKVARSNGKCRLCGLAMSLKCDANSDRHIEFDHMIPTSRGGSDRADNIQAICRKCNALKGAFTSPRFVIGDLIVASNTNATGGMDNVQ